jgi:hypothetical protein
LFVSLFYVVSLSADAVFKQQAKEARRKQQAEAAALQRQQAEAAALQQQQAQEERRRQQQAQEEARRQEQAQEEARRQQEEADHNAAVNELTDLTEYLKKNNYTMPMHPSEGLPSTALIREWVAAYTFHLREYLAGKTPPPVSEADLRAAASYQYDDKPSKLSTKEGEWQEHRKLQASQSTARLSEVSKENRQSAQQARGRSKKEQKLQVARGMKTPSEIRFNSEALLWQIQLEDCRRIQQQTQQQEQVTPVHHEDNLLAAMCKTAFTPHGPHQLEEGEQAALDPLDQI